MAETTPAADPTPAAETQPTSSASEVNAETKEAAKPAPAETIADAPDPDEDDLDDLDDLLDKFSANNISSSGPGRPAASTTASAPAVPTTKASGKDASAGEIPDFTGAEFSSQLQKEMAALFGHIDESPELAQQLDQFVKEMTSGAGEGADKASSAANPSASGNKGASASNADAAFTDTIKKTMERMAASEGQASAAAASSGEDDMFAQLLKDLAAGGGDGSDEDFSQMLLGMMQQLTNKDVLYEPMKELNDKFPNWIKENEGKTPAEDMTRYKEQQGLVTEIVSRFERKGYADENPEDREYIVERMQKMQAAGNPPQDLVGNVEDTHTALGNIGQDCAQQ